MSRWAAAFRLLGVGFYVAVCILGGVLAGIWLGDKFANRPLFVLLGLAVGLVVAFTGVYRMIRLVMDNKRGEENNQ